MKQLCILTVAVLLQSCNRQAGNTDAFFIKDHRDKFKHHNLRRFPRGGITDLNGPSPITDHHTPITGALAYRIFQDNNYVSDTSNEATKVLYAIQEHKGHQAILIAGMDDDWVDRIMYHSYDLQGRRIARLTLYEHGGDGGYYTEAYGQFINDSLYSRTTVNCEAGDEEAGETACDSVVEQFIIHSNGKIDPVKK